MKCTTLEEKLDLACKIAKSCFDRGLGSGMTGNLSFMHKGYIFITAGGTCFGFLTRKDFAAVAYEAAEDNGDARLEADDVNCSTDPFEAEIITDALSLKPSKELPLHKTVYDGLWNEGIREGAVIHTHSTYSVLWSCVHGLDPGNCVPDHTPYLRMKMGSCGLIPYEKPGSKELFDAFLRHLAVARSWKRAARSPGCCAEPDCKPWV